MPGKLMLSITAGSKAGTVFLFEEHDTMLLGRQRDCQICLPEDPRISRHHLLLEVNPPDARLRDLGSLHGTYINGQKYGGRAKHESPEEGARRTYPQVDLHDGDEIQVGKTVLQIHVEATASTCEPMRCQQCGNDLTSEVEADWQDEKLCAMCRPEAQDDPGALLFSLFPSVRSHTSAPLRVPNYQIIRELGKGGMGTVYLARHMHDGHQIALKVMLSKVAVNEHSRQRFLREMETTRALHHPNVITFLDGGALGHVFYFLLEFCEGGDVAHLMERRGGRLGLDEARPILLQSLRGLAYVHEQGFVHRDLKPQNILLSGGERNPVARIADLGLAKNFEQAGFSGMTATGSYAGSFPFMPREQVINFRLFKPVSDVWAMGATCYAVLTGTYPRNHRAALDQIEVILQGEIIPIRQRAPHIPASMAAVIDRALSPEPGDRYQHAGEMYAALERAWT